VDVPTLTGEATELLGQELAAAIKRFQVTIDAMPAGIVCFTEDLEVTAANRLLARSFGIGAGDLVGLKLDSLDIHPDFLAFAHRVFGDPEPRPLLELSMGPPDDPRHYALLARRYDNGKTAMVLVFDVTLRQRAERELRLALEKEREVSELRQRFISMVSHEFRTPLQTILLNTAMLGKQADADRRARSLDRIRMAAESMNRFLAGVLEIGRAEAGKIDVRPEKLDLRPFLEDLAEELGFGEGGEREILCSVMPAELTLQTDGQLLRVVLSNLITNAFKYSEPGKPVAISAGVERDRVTLVVRDEGPGISEDDLSRIFEPFERGSNVGERSGAGLGLSIVSRLVALLGGDVTATSRIGQGSAFSVRIPVETGQAAG
jgi:signal transduction histidine kinase